MSEHTASTRHIIDLAVSAEGDEGVGADYLRFVVKEALEAVGVEILNLDVSDDIGIGTERMAMVLNDGTTYTSMDGCTIVSIPDEIDDAEVDEFVNNAVHTGADSVVMLF